MFFSQIFSCCYEEMKLFMLMLFMSGSCDLVGASNEEFSVECLF